MTPLFTFQVADQDPRGRDLRVVDMLLASGWDLVVYTDCDINLTQLSSLAPTVTTVPESVGDITLLDGSC